MEEGHALQALLTNNRVDRARLGIVRTDQDGGQVRLARPRLNSRRDIVPAYVLWDIRLEMRGR